MTSTTKHRSRRRWGVLTALFTMVTGVLVATGTPAAAQPIPNTVTQTAFIWNCPANAPGCFPGVQTRVGDVRRNESLLDVCTTNFNNTRQNLVFNRTSRAGAAERAGFLHTSNLALTGPNGQNDSCSTAGLPQTLDSDDREQRLCPYFACGGVASIPTNSPVLRDFCYALTDGTEWRLIVAFSSATGGPLTAGFIPLDQLNPNIVQQKDCYSTS